MAERWLLPEFVFDGQDLRAETALRLVDEVVEGLYPASDAAKSAERISGVVSPGFIDLQVNGGGGVLFNSTPTSLGIQKIVAAHRQYGTTGILPTVITDTKDVLAQAVDAILDAQNIVGILGIHIEGPHISKERRGTHSEHLVRPMDNDTISHVKRLREAGIAVMITVAPEATTSVQISALRDLGAIVSIGHSDATADETRGAIQAGVE
ncbi:MAG: N-acetylglucosamine-6-phosphate deacetylase, partial [Dinoroseobacter sp.]|nr:N-acetylglucosamine-6-phosphate deacetylase [Dinoroseobacter sp.]